MYNEPSRKVEKRRQRISEGDASRGLAQIGRMTAHTMGGQNAQQVQLQDPDDEPEQPQLMIWVALLTLGISTVLVAVCAEFMVDSIDALTETGNISKTFVGLILLPIVGNAAEHATAVTVACKDKMDLAIGVAVGSSMQIALLVLPLIVVLGWIIGVHNMVCSLPFLPSLSFWWMCADCVDGRPSTSTLSRSSSSSSPSCWSTTSSQTASPTGSRASC